MAEKINRAAINYSDNYIDPFLMFETAADWDVITGTGASQHITSFAFEGSGCLYITNSDVENNITVTNSEQNTKIPLSGNFGFSMYLRKKAALQPISGNVKIFKNTVLLDTQSFTLGDVDAEKDELNEWVRFISTNNYDFEVNDVVTFTFTIDGIVGSGLTALNLYIDGLMLFQNERKNNVCPPYVRPEKHKNLPKLPTADGLYALSVVGGSYSWEDITPAPSA